MSIKISEGFGHPNIGLKAGKRRSLLDVRCAQLQFCEKENSKSPDDLQENKSSGFNRQQALNVKRPQGRPPVAPKDISKLIKMKTANEKRRHSKVSTEVHQGPESVKLPNLHEQKSKFDKTQNESIFNPTMSLLVRHNSNSRSKFIN